MKNWRIRSPDPEVPPETISPEDLAWRIGASSVRPVGPDGKLVAVEGQATDPAIGGSGRPTAEASLVPHAATSGSE